MKTVAVGLYNQLGNHSAEFQQRMQEITDFGLTAESNWYWNKTRTQLQSRHKIFSTSIDDIMTQADALAVDYVYIVASGHRNTIIDHLCVAVDHLKNTNHAALAHILQDDPDHDSQFYSLHHQCVLIDLNQWRQAGKPQWGTNTRVADCTLPAVARSQENFHDKYTPYWIAPSTNSARKYSGILREGWQLVKGIIESGQSIGNFPQEVRNKKMHLYPDSGGPFERMIVDGIDEIPTNFNQRRYMQVTSFKSAQRTVFVYNTDMMHTNIGMTYNKSTRLDTIYTVAAGFLPLQLLNSCQHHSNTRVVYFDYSQSALNFKKWLWQNWDGDDYNQAIGYYKNHIDTQFSPVWFIGKDYSGQWNEVLEYFGGKAAWLEFWRAYCKLEHEFIHCSLFGDYTALTNDMHNHPGNNLVWFSNSFHTEAALRYYSASKLKEMYSQCLSDFAKNNTSIQICGTDSQGIENWVHYGELT